ncbi:EPIDERMAL PATTERNING FACTOR-like protein [Drosera capensis]
MGRTQNCAFCCRKRYLLVSLAVILISSMTQDASMVQGRQIMTNWIQNVKESEKQIGDKNVAERSLIGSRPPRCESRCRNCRHCEAIQVPVTPQQRFKPAEGGTHSLQNSTPTTQYTRGDDMTNYIPMSWRCKCGDFIFNP